MTTIKYTYTGKSVLRMYIPTMIIWFIVIAIYVSLFNPIWSIIWDVIFFIVVYFGLGVFTYFMNRKSWKDNILWNHQITLHNNFFIWSNGKQEIKTNLDLLQKVVVSNKKIVIKFRSMRKVKLLQQETYEWYDDFMAKIVDIAKDKKIVVKIK